MQCKPLPFANFLSIGNLRNLGFTKIFGFGSDSGPGPGSGFGSCCGPGPGSYCGSCCGSGPGSGSCCGPGYGSGFSPGFSAKQLEISSFYQKVRSLYII